MNFLKNNLIKIKSKSKLTHQIKYGFSHFNNSEYISDIHNKFKFIPSNNKSVESLYNSLNDFINNPALDNNQFHIKVLLLGSNSTNEDNFTILLSLMNDIIFKKVKENLRLSFKDDQFFKTVKKVYEKIQKDMNKNQEKQYFNPQGVLVISPKFEFSTQLYRLARRIDYKNKLHISRIGTTLQNICPVIEHLDNETEANESELEEICKINLLLNTKWSNNDMMFISPIMMDFVMNNLEEYDKFDINPDIILINDFDYYIKSDNKGNLELEESIKKLLSKYFSSNSDFYNESTKKRKLILMSSTFPVQSLSEKEIVESNERISYIISSINKLIGIEEKQFSFQINEKDLFLNPSFMNINSTMKKNLNLIIERFKEKLNTVSNKSDPRLLYIGNMIDLDKDSEFRTVIVSSNEDNLRYLKDLFKRKKQNYSILEKESKVNIRLKALSDFNNKTTSYLIGPISFIRGMNFYNVKRIIVFDFVDDQRDYFKLVSKFDFSIENENLKNDLIVFITTNEKKIERRLEILMS